MFELFTPAARAVVVSAQEHARLLGHHEIGDGHLLLGVLTQTDGLGATILHTSGVALDAATTVLAGLGSNAVDTAALASIGIDLREVRHRAEATFGRGALDGPRRQHPGLFRHRKVPAAVVPSTAAAQQALRQSEHEAGALGDHHIATEHLLLGLLTDPQSTAATILGQLGATLDHTGTRDRILTARNPTT